MNNLILYKHVKKLLPPKRYEHTLGVVEVAIKLANKYGASVEKVEIAALLHDLAKYMSIDELHSYIECEQTLEYYGKFSELLHGFAGSNYAKQKLGVVDTDILNAIKYHTVGRRNMTLIEKLIYIADAIEPLRNYPSVDEIRNKVENNLDEAILFEINNKLIHLINLGVVIHPNTIEMRNWLLESGGCDEIK
jgi:predicted HD superfamily hydrolase involved in NAD metabolism